jgi:modulator of FtsH protease
MAAYDPARWSDFAQAQLGASAALLGLVFVGLSINLRDVIGSRQLVNRAAEAVFGLAAVLVTATAVLVPEQSRGVVSAELLVIALSTFSVTFTLQRGASRETMSDDGHGPPPISILLRRGLDLGAPVLLAVAGITLALEGGGGLYWWPVAIVTAFAGALLNAWVLMIEILR